MQGFWLEGVLGVDQNQPIHNQVPLVVVLLYDLDCEIIVHEIHQNVYSIIPLNWCQFPSIGSELLLDHLLIGSEVLEWGWVLGGERSTFFLMLYTSYGRL